MRISINKCYKCLCNVCTKFRCPYSDGRCALCYNNGFRYCFDCDSFEYYKTAPKRLKIVRKGKVQDNAINTKLDYIIENMGLVAPVIVINGTYDVVYDNIRLARFTDYNSAKEYVDKVQSEFSKPLRIVKINLDI